jgi:hypothetical protein
MENRTCFGDPEFSATSGRDDFDVTCYVDIGRVNVTVDNYRGTFDGTEQCEFNLNEDQARQLRDALTDFLELRAARPQEG